MTLVRKVAAIAVSALTVGVSAASAEPATTAACPPGHVEHPVEGCIPLPPGPY